ncbi:MAG: homoserine dehydrogenase [Dehalococcoidia bacterium]
MSAPNDIAIGLMGLGVVGTGAAQALLQKAEPLAQQAGCPLSLKRILVRDLQKPRSSPVPQSLLTTNPEDLLSDPDISILVEVMGGEHPALDFIQKALEGGKSVVTANKEVMAKHGPELLALAEARQVGLLFEASVGGGIPIIGPLTKSLLANEIRSMHTIINGTTNYILTRMDKDGLDFGQALREAQERGYAEPDPSDDVEGVDAAYKLAVLATLAFHTPVRFQDVYHEGISRLRLRDFLYARELGCTIKLLAIARRNGNALEVRVHPALVPQGHLLAKVDGAYNAIEVEGDLVGRVVFHGLGAGAAPTSSAVVGDILELARRIAAGQGFAAPSLNLKSSLALRPMSEVQTQYYLRFSALDRPGVLAQIGRTLGDLDISIASVIQKDTDPKAGTAELMLLTHPSREAAVQEALSQLAKLPVVKELSSVVRVEPLPT